jgi:hypothetical protein
MTEQLTDGQYTFAFGAKQLLVTVPSDVAEPVCVTNP